MILAMLQPRVSIVKRYKKQVANEEQYEDHGSVYSSKIYHLHARSSLTSIYVNMKVGRYLAFEYASLWLTGARSC